MTIKVPETICMISRFVSADIPIIHEHAHSRQDSTDVEEVRQSWGAPAPAPKRNLEVVFLETLIASLHQCTKSRKVHFHSSQMSEPFTIHHKWMLSLPFITKRCTPYHEASEIYWLVLIQRQMSAGLASMAIWYLWYGVYGDCMYPYWFVWCIWCGIYGDLRLQLEGCLPFLDFSAIRLYIPSLTCFAIMHASWESAKLSPWKLPFHIPPSPHVHILSSFAFR